MTDRKGETRLYVSAQIGSWKVFACRYGCDWRQPKVGVAGYCNGTELTPHIRQARDEVEVVPLADLQALEEEVRALKAGIGVGGFSLEWWEQAVEKAEQRNKELEAENAELRGKLESLEKRASDA